MARTKLVKTIIKDIENTITELRSNGLLRDENGICQNCSGENVIELSYSGKNDTNKVIFDKHLSYSKLINELLENRQYNILMYDKSLIQAEFILDDNEILKERLVFIKKHNRIWNKSEIDECDALDEDWFSEEEGIPIVIRIDFSPKDHKECEHSIAHFTLSNHECCRIPMKNAISFSEFISFILRHFYNAKLNHPVHRFQDSEVITEVEKKMIHINWK